MKFTDRLYWSDAGEKDFDFIINTMSDESDCDFFNFTSHDEFKNNNRYLCVIKHPDIYYNGEPAVLGFFEINFLNNKIYNDKKENKFVLCYVATRCSYMDSKFYYDQAIDSGYKPNKRNTFSIDVSNIMESFIRMKVNALSFSENIHINKCFMYNYSLDESVGYHLNNGWKLEAAKNLSEEIGFLPEEFEDSLGEEYRPENMWKYIDINFF